MASAQKLPVHLATPLQSKLERKKRLMFSSILAEPRESSVSQTTITLRPLAKQHNIDSLK